MRVCSRILRCKGPGYVLPSRTAAAAPGQAKPEHKMSCSALKRMPVPPLKATLEKFLRSARPFISSDEFIKSEEIIKEFISPGGLGETLHDLLLKRAEVTENWLEDYWLNTAYLGYRSPVVVYSSPAQIFPWQCFNHPDDFIMAAAKVVLGALEYKSMIDGGSIKQEMFSGEPLDMTQYSNVFGTCRTPCQPYDLLSFHQSSKHYVVITNNHFYKVCVPSQKPTINLIFHQLKTIYYETMTPDCAVGILTTDCRDNWAEAYSALMQGNEGVLKEIKEALFMVCMDRNCPAPVLNNMTTTALQTLHGNGLTENSGNRWYDKTLQFVICQDGGMGIAYEHSPAEGGVVSSLMDHIQSLLEKKMESGDAPSHMDCPEKLCFTVDSRVLLMIHTAAANLEKLIANLDVCVFSFNDFGKQELQQLKVSPDSFIQMAIQYAFYRIHKVAGAQYESGSLRLFKGGRTEVIRSCSIECIEFIRAMMDDQVPSTSKARALRGAMLTHKQYTVQAMHGEGVDRYLLGLKVVAAEKSLPRPGFLDDPSYTRSTHFRLSTSQVPCKADGVMVYGPLTEDGYACCYNPRVQSINFGTSVFKSDPTTDTARFRDSLETSLRHMKKILEENPVAKL